MNIIQYHKRETITPIRQECMDTIKNMGFPYTLIDKQPYPAETRKDIRFETDETRCRIAAKNPDALILDSDVVTTGISFIPDKKGKPYFYNNDPCIIYVNGCIDFFIKMMEWYDKTKKTLQIGWLQKYIREHEHYNIPKNCFAHLCLGMFGEKATYGSGQFAVYQENGQPKFKLRVPVR
jgi:hypothetical protein